MTSYDVHQHKKKQPRQKIHSFDAPGTLSARKESMCARVFASAILYTREAGRYFLRGKYKRENYEARASS
jgi:hypothetical protein